MSILGLINLLKAFIEGKVLLFLDDSQFVFPQELPGWRSFWFAFVHFVQKVFTLRACLKHWIVDSRLPRVPSLFGLFGIEIHFLSGQLVDGLGQVFESLLLNELLFNDGRFRNKLRSLSLHLLYQMINVIELHQLSQQTGSLKVSLIIQLLPRGKVIHILVEKWTDQVHALLQVYRREWIPITSFCQLFRLQQVKVAL